MRADCGLSDSDGGELELDEFRAAGVSDAVAREA